MLNNDHEKIKLAPKPVRNHTSRVGVVLALCVGFLVVLIGLTFLLNKDDGVRLRTSQKTFSLEVAQTPDEQEKGLGGRSSLPTDKGMIFIYNKEETRCFWMKDTAFPLDMVWLDSSYQITHIEPLVTPETYPMNFCGEHARFVIELPAGAAAQAQLAAGQILDLKHLP